MCGRRRTRVRPPGDPRRMDHAPHQPLLATADAALAEELTRLSAAAGAAVEVASTGPEVLGAWSTAPVVLVGADLVSALVELAPPRRPGVQVVAWSPVPTGSFRDALLVGAERVVELPGRRRADRRAAHRPRGGGPRRGRPGRRRGRLRRRRGDDAGLRARPGRGGPGADAGRRPRPAGSRVRPGARPRRRARRPVGLARHGVRPAERALAARGGAAPRRPGRAGVGLRSRLRSTPARSARPCRRRAAATTRWSSTSRARATSWPRRSRGARWSCWSSCRRSPVSPPRPGGWPRCPTRAGSGCWSVVAVPTRDGWLRSSVPRCSRPWPTSAGWPRPSTWAWVRSGRVADRSPPRPVSSSPASLPRRSQHEHRRGRARGRRPGPPAARRPPRRPLPTSGGRGVAGSGSSGRRRHRARRLRSVATRRARRRPSRAAAPAARRHRRARQRTRPGLRRPWRRTGGDRRPFRRRRVGAAARPAARRHGRSAPRRLRAVRRPAAARRQQMSRGARAGVPARHLDLASSAARAGLHPRGAARRRHSDAARRRAAARAGRGPGGVPGQRRHRQRQDDAPRCPALHGRSGRAAGPRRGRLRAAPGPSARRRARGAAGQRRGRGRHRPPHPGPAGPADASRPAGRRRGARRRGGRPAGRPQHRPRRWLRHPARQLRRRRAGPARGARAWPPASIGRRPTASSPPASPRWCTWRVAATACVGWPRSRCPAGAPTGSSRWSRPSRWSTERSETEPGRPSWRGCCADDGLRRPDRTVCRGRTGTPGSGAAAVANAARGEVAAQWPGVDAGPRSAARLAAVSVAGAGPGRCRCARGRMAALVAPPRAAVGAGDRRSGARGVRAPRVRAGLRSAARGGPGARGGGLAGARTRGGGVPGRVRRAGGPAHGRDPAWCR